MKKILAIVIAAMMITLSVTAVAEIYVKDNSGETVIYREEPSEDAKELGTLSPDETLIFEYQSSADGNGVSWYLANLDDDDSTQVWVSSEYTTISDGTVDGIEFNAANRDGSYKMSADDTVAVSPVDGVGDTDVKAGDDILVWGCSYTVEDGTKYTYITTMDDVSGWVHDENLVKDEESTAVDTAAETDAEVESGEKTVTLDNGLSMTYDASEFTVNVNDDNTVIAEYRGGIKAGFSISRSEGTDAETMIAENAAESGAEVDCGRYFSEEVDWYSYTADCQEDDVAGIETHYARNNADGAWVINTYFFPSGDEETDMACSDAIEMVLNTLTFAD